MLKSISFKLKIVLVIFTVILTLGALSLYVVNKLESSTESDGLKSFQTYAEGLSASIQAQFFERYGDIQAFASNEVLQSKDMKKIELALNKYISLYGIYDLIVFTDMSGNLIATSSVDPSGKNIETKSIPQNFSTSNWFLKVKANELSNDKDKGFSGTYVEDVKIDEVTSKVYGKEMYGNTFSTVVKDQSGNHIGVISAKAGWRWVEYEFQDWYKRLNAVGLGSSELTMLNKSGAVIIDYDPTVSKTLEIKRNFEKVLLKLNLVKLGVGAAVKSTSGEIGSSYSFHARKEIDQISGYAAIKGSKFVEDLGWSVLVRADKDEFLHSLISAKNEFYIIFSILLCGVLGFSIWFAGNIGSQLKDVANRLDSRAQMVFNTSKDMAEQSTTISEAAKQQSSSLQETAASINEISSMVKKNLETAEVSKNTSDMSKNAARVGKNTVEEMIQAINGISESNKNVQTQMDGINGEFANIINVIREIGEKTKVINDIVFQTKLLSFNASVEAARAGEHGKGFAVVAEEVGNLAEMSGGAANEISSMLEGSIQQVENILGKAKEQMTALMHESGVKVENGISTAHKCGDSLEKIDSNVSSVARDVDGIAVASREQSSGIEEVNTAMMELERVTQQNTKISEDSSKSASGLREQAEALNDLVSGLLEVVNGKNKNSDLKANVEILPNIEDDQSKKAA